MADEQGVDVFGRRIDELVAAPFVRKVAGDGRRDGKVERAAVRGGVHVGAKLHQKLGRCMPHTRTGSRDDNVLSLQSEQIVELHGHLPYPICFTRCMAMVPPSARISTPVT